MTGAAQVRLDVELVRRGLARSREDAVDLIRAGSVRVGSEVGTKAARKVTVDDDLAVVGADRRWVGRAAGKLDGALDLLMRRAAARDGSGDTHDTAVHAGPVARPSDLVRGRRCLDAGASTGGFTEVLLRRGAREVVAVDVGHGQLVEALRTDPRVLVREHCHVRDLDTTTTAGPVSLVVADLSFISLTLVLEPLLRVCEPTADLVLMVKPQFEVGRERLGRGGVVREPELRAESVLGVARAGAALGLRTLDVVTSPVPGATGNVEYFLWLRRTDDDTASDDDTDATDGIEDTDSTDSTDNATGRSAAHDDLRTLVEAAVREDPR